MVDLPPILNLCCRAFILTCIDARLVPYDALGLEVGDCHVFRNAGGRLSDDAIRSFTMTQQLMGTREVFVMHHTKCGVEAITHEELVDVFKKNVGQDASKVDFKLCKDARESVKDDVEAFKACPLVNPGTTFTGLMYDVDTGRVDVVCPSSST